MNIRPTHSWSPRRPTFRTNSRAREALPDECVACRLYHFGSSPRFSGSLFGAWADQRSRGGSNRQRLPLFGPAMNPRKNPITYRSRQGCSSDTSKLAGTRGILPILRSFVSRKSLYARVPQAPPNAPAGVVHDAHRDIPIWHASRPALHARRNPRFYRHDFG